MVSSPSQHPPSLKATMHSALLPSDIKEALLLFLEHLAYERRVSMATVLAYASDLRLLFEEAARAGAKKLSDVTVSLINSVLAAARWRRGRPLHPRSIGRRHTALRTFYKWASESYSAELVDITPWLITPPQERKAPRPLLVPTALSLMQTHAMDASAALAAPSSAAAATTTELRDLAVLLLLYGPGLMRHEVLSLRLEDVNLNDRWLRVTGRGRKAREVPIPTGCIAGLKAYVSARVATLNPYFLCGRGPAPLSPRTLLRIVARAAQQALGHHATPRQLRHSFATHLVADGARLGHIQQMLGHTTAKATERYREVALSELRAVMNTNHPRTRPGG